MKYLLLFTLFLTFYGNCRAQEKLEKEVSCYVIRFSEPFEKKEIGKVYEKKYRLLDICPKRQANLAYQEAKITVIKNGKEIETGFDVKKIFASHAEARDFAEKNSITDTPFAKIADCQIIRQVQIPLTKKPNVPTESKIALLDTCLNDEIPQQRPVIEVLRNGKKEFRVFEIIKFFTEQSEAEMYAKDNGLLDVDFSK